MILILLKLSLIGGGGISKVEIKFDKIRKNFNWRRRPPGLILTLSSESIGSEWD